MLIKLSGDCVGTFSVYSIRSVIFGLLVRLFLTLFVCMFLFPLRFWLPTIDFYIRSYLDGVLPMHFEVRARTHNTTFKSFGIRVNLYGHELNSICISSVWISITSSFKNLCVCVFAFYFFYFSGISKCCLSHFRLRAQPEMWDFNAAFCFVIFTFIIRPFPTFRS